MTTYPNPPFDNEAIERFPGCAFIVEDDGSFFWLGHTQEGASLVVEQGAEAQNTDEGGATPAHYVSMGATGRMELNLLETNLARFGRVCPTATFVNGRLRFGIIPGARLPTLKIVHRPFAWPDGSKDLVIERATMVGDQTFAHKHTEPMMLTCVFEACIDETADSGALIGAGIGA